MSFSSAVTGTDYIGTRKMVMGTFNAASVTTGDIVTGLVDIENFSLQNGASATALIGSVSGGTITITCASGDTGFWSAVGK